MKLKISLLLIFFLLPFLSGCAELQTLKGKIKTPEISFEKVEIAEITLEDIKLIIQTEVKNPYPINLPASSLNLDVKIEGTQFSKVQLKLDSVPGSSKKPLPIEVKLKYADLAALYKKVPGKKELLIRIEGEAALPIPEKYAVIAGTDSLKFPFQDERLIPAVLPNIEIRNFKIIKPDVAKITESANSEELAKKAVSFLDALLSPKNKKSPGSALNAGLDALDISIDTQFELVLNNKAASDLQFQDLNFELFLENDKFLTGSPVNITNNGKESILTIRTSFPLKSVSNSIANAVTKRSSSFRLTGKAAVVCPGVSSDPIGFGFIKEGNFRW
ncbi:hypothetical protein EHQ76_08970 [Leptospira barantonii]|uniref:Water stress and hypersensitive response domain-containing protein n=1 Tax=Leptospira barantonii TaxID=2023184 RepID=A0A5F2BDW3_9LEPT|nr:LEA type 2 family protein [Leptospira barantonii]TGM03766.1 hypothetical protein EHQ76_08970 [Leptospira barantonii]